jgi:putative DNA primase/helicase
VIEGQATNAVRDAAMAYAERGWPIFPLRARSKVPLTLHGFKDATTDERTILRWFERWPNANLGVACGEPGPTVLDIDDPGAAGDLATRCSELGAPIVATARGVQFYFAGTDSRTVGLGYGELRSRGSYVVAPPSVHPTGKVYTWIAAPRKTLPGIPDIVARRVKDRSTAGSGKAPVRERVPPGQMYEYLLDRAVRLARAGEADPDIIEAPGVIVGEVTRTLVRVGV